MCLARAWSTLHASSKSLRLSFRELLVGCGVTATNRTCENWGTSEKEPEGQTSQCTASFKAATKSPAVVRCFLKIVFSPTALALGSLAIVKVSGRPPPLAFLGANSVGLEKGSVEGSPNICHSGLSVLLGPWGKFRWPRKRFPGFCGRFPQLFFTFVSRSSLRKKVLWKDPPTFLCICLPVFSGYVEGSPNSSVHLSPNFLFEKGSGEGSLNFFPIALALGPSAIVKGLFAANGFRLPKGPLECSPNNSLHLSHSLLRFFGQMAVASEKVQWRVPPTILYICLPSCFLKALWRVPPTVLYIYLRLSSQGQSW